MAAANQVRVSGSLYLPWVLVESNERNCSSKLTAMIRVKAPPLVCRSNANPIHVAVVLDVMGKQQEAGPDLLKTMEFIRREFHGDAAAKDRIDVVYAFDDQVTTTTIDGWISDAQAGKQNQENPVPRSQSQTELRLVLESAVQILDKSKLSSGDVKRVGFILLLSDGQRKLKVNKSVNNLLSMYPVHAFGLGSNHDPEMLHDIAKASRGTYSSIAHANNLNSSSKVMEAVALCLGGLKSVVAIGTHVKIDVVLDRYSDSLMEDDIKIKIQPGGHDISGSKEGFLVGDGILYAGEVKDLIVDINFCTVKKSSRTRSATLTATVEYEDSSHKEGLPAQCNLPLLVTGTSNRPAMEAYGKLEEFLPNSMVLQRMIMLEVLEKLVKFAKDNLKLPPPPPPSKRTRTTTTTTTTTPTPQKKKTTMSTTATSRPPPPKKTTMSTTSTRPPPTKKTTPTTGNLLRSMWKELKKQGKNLKVAQKISDLIDLRGMDNDVEAMASCLEREGVSSGLSCIYSWVSSYQMQRATTTGLPPPPAPATPFLTPDMEAMVHNARNKQQLVAQKPPPSPPVQVQEGVVEDKQDDTVAQKKPPSPSPPVVQEDGAVETVVKQDDMVAQEEPSPPVQTKAVEMGKQQDDIQLVAQDEPLPPSVQKDAMKTPSTGDDEKMPPAQLITSLDLDDEKSKVAIQLIEYINVQFRSYESYAQPIGLPMSKGGQMFQRRHTTDDLDFLKNKIYEAAEIAINEWGRLNATSGSGN